MEIAVRFSPLTAQTDSLGGYADLLQRYADQVGQIRGRLSASMKTKSNVGAALQAAADSIEARARAMSRMERGLRELVPLYRACETALAGGEADRVSAAGAEDAAGSSIVSWGDLWDAAKSFGTVGGVIGGVGEIMTGDNWAGKGKGVASLVGAGAEAADQIAKGTYGIDHLFGFHTVDPTNALTQKLDDLVIGSGKSAWSNVAAGATWAAALLGNFSENIEEFDGDYGNIRMYRETAIETAVDVGLDIAATAAISTAAAAIGFTAAPAFVVAAAGVAVVWGANALCKWATGGKDIGEVAADFVCDASEAIDKAVGDAAKAVTKGAKAVWNKITSWF